MRAAEQGSWSAYDRAGVVGCVRPWVSCDRGGRATAGAVGCVQQPGPCESGGHATGDPCDSGAGVAVGTVRQQPIGTVRGVTHKWSALQLGPCCNCIQGDACDN